MLHSLTEEGGVPFLYREAQEIARELDEQQRIAVKLRRLGDGLTELTEELDGEGSDLLLRLLGEAEEIASDCKRAIAESERLLGTLDEERRELMALMGRI